MHLDGYEVGKLINKDLTEMTLRIFEEGQRFFKNLVRVWDHKQVLLM